MVYSTDNPVAIQSQQWLATALLELMKEKPYHQITIKEIAEKADLNRSTFYRNFNSKEDILRLHLDFLAQEYINRINEANKIDMSGVARILMAFFNENLDFICSLRKNGLSSFLLEAFNLLLPHIHRATIGKYVYTISEENLELALAFNAGGMWNLLMKWIDTGFVYSYSDLVKAFEEISAFNFKSNE